MEHCTTIRVRYAETDAQGIAHHAGYPVWFEEGRSDFLRKVGVPYSQWEAAGYFVVVADLHCRYLTAMRYEQQLTIVTRLERFRKRVIDFSYQVLDEQQAIVAAGETQHLIINANGRITALADDFYQHIRRYLGV